MDWSRFSDLNFWKMGLSDNTSFVYNPINITSPFFWGLLNFGVLVSVLGLGLAIYNQFEKQNYRKKFFSLIANNAITFGLLFIAWFLARITTVFYLGSPSLIFIFAIYFCLVLAYILRYYFTFYKIEEQYIKRMRGGKDS